MSRTPALIMPDRGPIALFTCTDLSGVRLIGILLIPRSQTEASV